MSFLIRLLTPRRCKCTMDVCQQWLVVEHLRCELDAEHPGFHRSGKYTWNDNQSMRRFFEANYRDLPK